MYAPVVIFVYDRLEHVQQTVDALLANQHASETDVIFYSDAAKNLQGSSSVEEVRNYIRTVTGFRSVSVVLRDVNFGLARSIIEGVTEVLKQYGRIIVLEDDMVTSPYFLTFMNSALTLYAADERVVSVHGYVYPVSKELPETFFLLGADCWGWATWSRGWSLFNPDGDYLLRELKKHRLTRKFDFGDSYPYTQMLKNQVLGRNSSWAVRWYASTFLAGKLTLYPGKSLIHNIGNDNSGTHCVSTSYHDVAVSTHPIAVGGIEVAASQKGMEAFKEFFLSSRESFLARVVRVAKRCFS